MYLFQLHELIRLLHTFPASSARTSPFINAFARFFFLFLFLSALFLSLRYSKPTSSLFLSRLPIRLLLPTHPRSSLSSLKPMKTKATRDESQSCCSPHLLALPNYGGGQPLSKIIIMVRSRPTTINYNQSSWYKSRYRHSYIAIQVSVLIPSLLLFPSFNKEKVI